VDGDGYDDLGAGAPYEDLGTISNAGWVTVRHGAYTGLGGYSSIDHGHVAEIAASDSNGYSLTMGDFDGDGDADVASGIPGQDSDGAAGHGAVMVADIE